MIKDRWLICGTRKKGYNKLVSETLEKMFWDNKGSSAQDSDWKLTIIEGCCPDSADTYAEEWAKSHNIECIHHPSTSGNYLKRNIEMVNKCNLVIAFWDGYSYGTAHTMAQAAKRNIPVVIIDLK